MKKTVIAPVILSTFFYAVSMNPDITGIAIHEWASILLVVMMLLHFGMYMDWVLSSLKRIRMTASTGHLILDIVLLFLFVLVTVSGLTISRFVMPTLNLTSQGYYFWSPIHAISAKLLFAGVIVHVVVHYKWFFALARKIRTNMTIGIDTHQE